MINPFQRYQKGLSLQDIFPIRNDSICACGCGKQLTGRNTRWSSKECNDKAYIKFAIIKGDQKVIRQELEKRDKGICKECGLFCNPNEWEADHIIEVHHGGSGCTLDGFQTLCIACHKEKTKINK